MDKNTQVIHEFLRNNFPYGRFYPSNTPFKCSECKVYGIFFGTKCQVCWCNFLTQKNVMVDPATKYAAQKYLDEFNENYLNKMMC